MNEYKGIPYARMHAHGYPRRYGRAQVDLCVGPTLGTMVDHPSSKGPGREYDILQRLFSQVSPLSSEFVPSGQVVVFQLTEVKSALVRSALVRSAPCRFA